MAEIIDVDMPPPAQPQQKKRSHDVIDLLEDDDVVVIAPPKKPRPEVVDVDALDSDDDADDNGERPRRLGLDDARRSEAALAVVVRVVVAI